MVSPNPTSGGPSLGGPRHACEVGERHLGHLEVVAVARVQVA